MRTDGRRALPFIKTGALILAIGGASLPRQPVDHVSARVHPGLRSGDAGARSADQVPGCPRAGTAGLEVGEVAWFFPTDSAINDPPAIGDDGALYFVALNGRVYSIHCRGSERWRVDTLMGRSVAAGAAVLHAGGKVYFAVGGSQDGTLLAVPVDGASRLLTVLNQRVEAAPVIDRQDRVFVGAASRTVLPDGIGGIRVFDLRLAALPGYPLASQSIGASPVVLAHDRVVFASRNNPRGGGVPIGNTATPTLPLPPRRTPTPASSIAPTASRTPDATPSPSLSPSPSSTASASATPGATRSPERWSVFLPLARFGQAGTRMERSLSAEDRPFSVQLDTLTTLSQPVEPRAPALPTPTNSPGSTLSELYVITDAQAPGKVYSLGKGSASSLIATGDVVMVTLDEQPPRMAGLALEGGPPIVLWEHFTAGAIAGSPVLGRLDRATGMVELIYADATGLVVSLMVPGTPECLGEPRFNWAIRLDEPAVGAPALGDDGLAYVATAQSVHAIRRADGDEAWSLLSTSSVGPIDSSVTLAPGGMLYVGTRNGVQAIATGSKGLDPEARWPALRRDHRNSGWAEP